jgi:hypothetical protein
MDRFITLDELSNYVINRFNDMSGEGDLAHGEKIKIPAMGALVIEAQGSTRVDGASRQQASTSSIELTVDQEPWIPVQVPAIDQVQSLHGRFMEEVADQAMLQLRNYMDGLILDDYLATQVNFDSAGAYHHNVESDGLTAADILVARGLQLRNKSSSLQALTWILDPLAAAAVMGFAGWREVPSDTEFGASMIGKIFGMPVIETQAGRLQSQWTQAGATLTAAAEAAGVITLTFSQNTGIVPGNLVSLSATSGGTHDFVEQAVQSVNAGGTQITVASAVGNAADLLGGATIVTEDSAHNLLVDTRHVYTAFQKLPRIRFLPDPETTGDIMQVSTLFGMLARAGRSRTVHTPVDAI